MAQAVPSLEQARARRVEASRQLEAGDPQRAVSLAREALGMYMAHRDPAWLIAEAEIVLSQCLRANGDLTGALERAAAAAERCEQAPGAAALFVHALAQYGAILMDLDEYHPAASVYHRALAELSAMDDLAPETIAPLRQTLEQNLATAETRISLDDHIDGPEGNEPQPS
jgi:tetratricopeptide (TPR) repeat protein